MKKKARKEKPQVMTDLRQKQKKEARVPNETKTAASPLNVTPTKA